MLYIALSGSPRTIHLRPINISTQAVGNGVISTLTISNLLSTHTSANRALKYRPNVLTELGGRMATLFINMEAAIPYYQCSNVFSPICHIFTFGEDGLHFGKPFIQISDPGYQYATFSFNHIIATYGFGVSGCSTFDFACVSDFEVTLVCLLPSAECD